MTKKYKKEYLQEKLNEFNLALVIYENGVVGLASEKQGKWHLIKYPLRSKYELVSKAKDFVRFEIGLTNFDHPIEIDPNSISFLPLNGFEDNND